MKENQVNKGKIDYQDIWFRDYEHRFMIARFKKAFTLPTDNPKNDYLYFLYILKDEYKVTGKEKGKTKIQRFNVMVYNQSYESFYEMVLSIQPILEEYILDMGRRNKLLNLVTKLNPKYYAKAE
ncbi:hypothetical protein [Bacillus coahuilensis]|uniref:hypothetical protein n=1 Tax=Bacillus coahuilensis TaxID=408580 RepID=UPI00018512FC|nr:hypothetical protein [Bacillus coahuilensis]